MYENTGQTSFTAAAVQAGPVFRDAPEYIDGEATLAKAIELIGEAGSKGAQLIVFPECWLPCFPYWSLDLTSDRTLFAELWAKLLWSSVEVPGPTTDALAAAARQAGAYLVIGINERDSRFRGRMYNSMLYIDPSGEILGTHRKICNTVQERFFHCAGDGGQNLDTVFPTAIGQLGGSMCGEHSQLTLAHHWIMQGIQIHCSLWPGHGRLKSTTDILSRAFCLNAGAFGVVAATFIPEQDRPKNFYPNNLFDQPQALVGGSGVVNPWGQYLAGPVYEREEIVYAEIDLLDTDRSRCGVNLTGLYSRWDLLQVVVNEHGYEPFTRLEPPGLPQDRLMAERNFLQQHLRKLDQALAAVSTPTHPTLPLEPSPQPQEGEGQEADSEDPSAERSG